MQTGVRKFIARIICRFLRSFFAKSDRLLVSQLLTLARAEPGLHRSVMREPVALMALARDITREWVPRALTRQIDLGFDDASAAATISAGPLLVHAMLNNLIDNAIQYTPAGGRVTVRIRQQGDQATLEIEADGPGIPTEEQEKVFERFYRIPGGAPEGCGLGLAIIREIAQGHQATVAVRSGAGGRGARITVRFPSPP